MFYKFSIYSFLLPYVIKGYRPSDKWNDPFEDRVTNGNNEPQCQELTSSLLLYTQLMYIVLLFLYQCLFCVDFIDV